MQPEPALRLYRDQPETKSRKYKPVVKKIDEVIADVMTIASIQKTRRNEKTSPQQV